MKKINKEWIMDHAIYIVLIALFVIIIAIEPSFLSLDNFVNILSQSSTRIIIALGIGGIVIVLGTDLSAGRMVGLAAVLSASMLQATNYAYRMYPHLQQLPIYVPILIAIAIGAVLGILNGIIVAVLKVPPFIATLGTQIIIYGLTSIYYDRPPLGAQPIGGLDKRFTTAVTGSFGPVPKLIVYAIVVTAIIWVLWNKTKFGKNMYAIGGNPEAAAVSGVNVTKYLILIYMLAGALYGFAGALEAGRVGSATNNTGNMYELDAIAACVVGGVSLAGGVGTVPGVITGVLIFQVINYGLAFIGLNPYFQFIVKGLIIVGAVSIDIQKYLKKK